MRAELAARAARRAALKPDRNFAQIELRMHDSEQRTTLFSGQWWRCITASVYCSVVRSSSVMPSSWRTARMSLSAAVISRSGTIVSSPQPVRVADTGFQLGFDHAAGPPLCWRAPRHRSLKYRRKPACSTPSVAAVSLYMPDRCPSAEAPNADR